MSNESFIVIVESPAKARTIQKILGTDYNVKASYGHIRDLPKIPLGVNIEKGFEPRYVITNTEVVQSLKQVCRGARVVFLASDPDREGEAIAWHLAEVLKGDVSGPFKRVTMHEITPRAVKESFRLHTDINMNLVYAQQARRILDRLVGFKVSPILWTQFTKGIGAGRVQSVALRIICEREREIRAFQRVEYWNIRILLEAGQAGSGKLFEAKLIRINEQKAEIKTAEEANQILESIKRQHFHIARMEIKNQKRSAPPPFITSSLQQTSSFSLHLSPSQTMQIAQQLYDGVDIGLSEPTGLITYMRTDSFRVSKEAIEACRHYIASQIGAEYLPKIPPVYKSPGRAQEAHEAIRPTDISRTPNELKSYLSEEQFRVYELIWKRLIASQMKPLERILTDVDTAVVGSDDRKFIFRAIFAELTFAGYLRIYDISENEADDKPSKLHEEDEEQKLTFSPTELAQNQEVFPSEVKSEQKFTEPPPRYSESMLIRVLEQNQIGRPSTYASIAKNIQEDKYIYKQKGKLIPSELGFKVNDFLVDHFPILLEKKFTAEMETKLDKVEEGEMKWNAMLEEFYKPFSEWIENAKRRGSPPSWKVEKIIVLSENVKKWNPEKKNRRLDDRNFLLDIIRQYRRKGYISLKQWIAFLDTLYPYRDQIPDFNQAMASLEVDTSRWNPNEEQLAENQRYRDILTRLHTIVSEENNDGARQFISSLIKWIDAGRNLTKNQMHALEKMKIKYQEQLPTLQD